MLKASENMGKKRRKHGKKKQKTKISWSHQQHYYEKCRHYEHPFNIGNVVIYASSWNDRVQDRQMIPDWGLYADYCWKPMWRNEHILWPDFGAPENEILAFEQILDATEKAISGKKVEFGCIGGHGRTGTMLAVACVIADMTPKQAISKVRNEYCSHTIESDLQEWFIEWVWCTINMQPLPKKPAPDLRHVFGGLGQYGNKQKNNENNGSHIDCTMSEHWEMWLDGETCNNGSGCNYYDEDIERFKKGRVAAPAAVVSSKNIRLEDYRIVNGYRVPVTVKHNPKNDKCACDVCRYLRKGHGAFLEPDDRKKRDAWEEKQVDSHIKIAETILKRNSKRTISDEYVYTNNGWEHKAVVERKNGSPLHELTFQDVTAQ